MAERQHGDDTIKLVFRVPAARESLPLTLLVPELVVIAASRCIKPREEFLRETCISVVAEGLVRAITKWPQLADGILAHVAKLKHAEGGWPLLARATHIRQWYKFGETVFELSGLRVSVEYFAARKPLDTRPQRINS